MPTRDKKRVNAELFGFRMAVLELNRSLGRQAGEVKPAQVRPEMHTPRPADWDRPDETNPASRFVRAASEKVAAIRRKRGF